MVSIIDTINTDSRATQGEKVMTLFNIFQSVKTGLGLQHYVRDAVHTHFFTLIVKWTIVSGWVKHRVDNSDKVAKLRYKSFVTSLERADKKTGWVGKKLNDICR